MREDSLRVNDQTHKLYDTVSTAHSSKMDGVSAAGSSEATEVQDCEQNALARGAVHGSRAFLISATWWNAWRLYSGFRTATAASSADPAQPPAAFSPGPRPGPINNEDLLPTQSKSASASEPEDMPLRAGLREHTDFVAVSEETWTKLHGWYKGGPAIARHIVSSGDATVAASGKAWLRVSLYPYCLDVYYKETNGPERTKTVKIEPERTLGELKVRACCLLEVSEAEVELWDYTGRKPQVSLEVDPATSIHQPSTSASSARRAKAGRGKASDGADIAYNDHNEEGGDAAAAAPWVGASVQAALVDRQVLLLRRKGDTEDSCGSDTDSAFNNNTNNTTAARGFGDNKQGSGFNFGAAIGNSGRAAQPKRASNDGNNPPVLPVRTGANTSGAGGFGSGGVTNRTTSFGRNSWMEDAVVSREGQTPGMAGLSNLGNTCFMNSSLQCLSHTVPLMRAFLGGAFMLDLNRTNPLGMKGELAEAFGALMQSLWRGGVSAVTPRMFKAKIGRFAPQFSGYAQHDSQEFLAFLLDGMHEDTNRIRVKPYIEVRGGEVHGEEKDIPGRPDEALAEEAWANYRARNDSLVVDHFQGLYKSTVDCPQCGFNSVKFDPFMYLSLPLPESRIKCVEVVLVNMAGEAPPMRMALEMASGATLKDLAATVGRMGQLPAEVIAAADQHMLVAKPVRGFNSTTEELVVWTDSRMRLLDALDHHGSSSTSGYGLRSSSAQNSGPGLVVYYWPDAQHGPKSTGTAPVIVHFRRPNRGSSWPKIVFCGAPLVLFLPDAPVVDPTRIVSDRGPNKVAEELVVDTSGTPLAAALATVLQPFLRPGVILQQPGDEPAMDQQQQQDGDAPADAAMDVQGPGAAPAASGGPAPMDLATPATALPAVATGVGVGAGLAGGARAGAGGGGAPAGGLDHLPGALAQALRDDEPGPGTPPRSGGAAVAPAEAAVDGDAAMAVGDEAMDGLAPIVQADDVDIDVPGTPPLQSAPSPQQQPFGPAAPPFNMWAAQEQQAAASSVLHPQSGAFTVKVCNAKGETPLYSNDMRNINRDNPRQFVVEFAEPSPAYDTDQLDTPTPHPTLVEQRQRQQAGPQPCSLSQCMETFLQPERLSESDAWYCPRCKAHVCADKKLDLWSLPEVLVVHLKRFSYTRHSRDKLDTRVDFPLRNLDLTPYVLRQQGVPPVYDLYAVSNHYGSLGGGHYTAYAKLPGAEDRWCAFDDSHVSPVNPEAVRSNAAYVLFYRRRQEAEQDPPQQEEMLEALRAQRAVSSEAAQGLGGGGGDERDGGDRQADPDQGHHHTNHHHANNQLALVPVSDVPLEPQHAVTERHADDGGGGLYGPPGSPTGGGDGLEVEGRGGVGSWGVGHWTGQVQGEQPEAMELAGNSGRSSPEPCQPPSPQHSGAGYGGASNVLRSRPQPLKEMLQEGNRHDPHHGEHGQRAGAGSPTGHMADAGSSPNSGSREQLDESEWDAGPAKGTPGFGQEAAQEYIVADHHDWASDGGSGMSGERRTHDMRIVSDEEDDAAGGPPLGLMSTSPN